MSLALACGLLLNATIVGGPAFPQSTPRELDYSKPVFTNDRAIVCPLAMIVEAEANGKGQAAERLKSIYPLTSSPDDQATVAIREAKAQAFGCHILKGGVRVSLQPGASKHPEDDFLGLDFNGEGFLAAKSQLHN